MLLYSLTKKYLPTEAPICQRSGIMVDTKRLINWSHARICWNMAR